MEKLNFEQMECVNGGSWVDWGCFFGVLGIGYSLATLNPITLGVSVTTMGTMGCFEATY